MVKKMFRARNPKLNRILFVIGFVTVSFQLSTALAQQPQTSVAPVFAANSKYVQGVGPGYWPTAGAGLTLNLAAGTAFCGSPPAPVTYAGGTLMMAPSQTNYVYLDPAASCAPASNTVGFSFGRVPLATVVTGASAITSIVDLRGWFLPVPVGTDSNGHAVAKVLNNIRFTDQFPGANTTAKLDAAIADIGAGPGMIISPPGLGSGLPSSSQNNIGILDLRQTYDPIAGADGDPDRTPLVMLENRLGNLTTKPLTGTVTLTNGSTAVTGVGTKFLTELANHYGRSIRLNSDPVTAWAEVGTVADDTHVTLAVAYPGAGGTGAASYFVTQLGLLINTLVSGGTPNTNNGGEAVGLTIISARSGGSRSLYGANINLEYYTAPDAHSTAMGLEIDHSNFASDAPFPWDGVTARVDTALHILSAGAKHPGTALSIFRTTDTVNEFRTGIWINRGANTGIRIDGNSNHLYLVPTSDNSSNQILGRNAADSATKWAVNNDGGGFFSGPVGLGISSAVSGSKLHAYVSAADLEIPIRVENDNGSPGAAVAIGFGGTSTPLSGGSEVRSFKAGIGLVRNLGNARGDLCLFNRLTDDTNNFTTSDAFLCGRAYTTPGRLDLYALGTNQPITLNPSGTGGVLVPGASGDDKLALLAGPAVSSYDPYTQGFLTSSTYAFGSLNSPRFNALVAVSENNTTAAHVGFTGAGISTHTSGTKVAVEGLEGNAYHIAAGTVSQMHGVAGYAEMDGTNGTVGDMMAFYAYSNVKTAGTVNNNYGLYVDAQTAGTNNYSVYTVGTAPAKFGGPVISGVNVASFSATPTFDAALGNTQKITLTGNVTSSTLSNASAGEQINFIICQDSNGNHTFVWPANVLGGMTIGATASKCSSQSFIFDGTNTYALSAGMTNM